MADDVVGAVVSGFNCDSRGAATADHLINFAKPSVRLGFGCSVGGQGDLFYYAVAGVAFAIKFVSEMLAGSFRPDHDSSQEEFSTFAFSVEPLAPAES